MFSLYKPLFALFQEVGNILSSHEINRGLSGNSRLLAGWLVKKLTVWMDEHETHLERENNQMCSWKAIANTSF